MSFTEFPLADNYHEFYPQFTHKTVGSRRIPVEVAGQIVMRRMRNWSERVKPQPFAITLHEKAA